MYRQPLLTVEDAQPLIGQMTRLEFSDDPDNVRNWSGVILRTGAYYGDSDRHIFFRRSDGSEDDVLFIRGTNVVFATTVDSFIPPEEEAPFVSVRWRDRGQLSRF